MSGLPAVGLSGPLSSAATRGAAASVLPRVLAGVAGLLVLLAATGATLGFVLPALLGLKGAWLWARYRRRPMTRGAAWLGSVVGAAAGVALALVLTFATLPPGSLTSANC